MANSNSIKLIILVSFMICSMGNDLGKCDSCDGTLYNLDGQGNCNIVGNISGLYYCYVNKLKNPNCTNGKYWKNIHSTSNESKIENFIYGCCRNYENHPDDARYMNHCWCSNKNNKTQEIEWCTQKQGCHLDTGKCINTPSPTKNPTKSPTKSPTKNPTKNPSGSPTKKPTKAPSKNPTKNPSGSPTKKPTKAPSKNPTKNPSKSPSKNPTKSPTKTRNPTDTPTTSPTDAPTKQKSESAMTSNKVNKNLYLGIGIGGGIFFIFVVGLIIWYCYYRKNNYNENFEEVSHSGIDFTDTSMSVSNFANLDNSIGIITQPIENNTFGSVKFNKLDQNLLDLLDESDKIEHTDDLILEVKPPELNEAQMEYIHHMDSEAKGLDDALDEVMEILKDDPEMMQSFLDSETLPEIKTKEDVKKFIEWGNEHEKFSSSQTVQSIEAVMNKLHPEDK